jgi:peptidoglycan/LPS O-acetylase OafA/YrhL
MDSQTRSTGKGAERVFDELQVSKDGPLLRPKMRELDSLRGIASVSVVLYHCFNWALMNLSIYGSAQRLMIRLMAAGQFGVNLFFVLSGFLITGLLIDSKNRADYYKRFYIRRALRILPAYYAILVLLAVFQIASRRFLIASALYSANLAPLFGIPISYGVLWSLGVEEHFYLVWPAVIHRITLRTALAVSVAVITVSPVLRFVCALHAIPRHFQGSECGFYTWNVADGLAYGAVLAIVMRAYSLQRGQLRWFSLFCLGLAGIVTLTGLPFGITTRLNAVGAALQGVPWDLASLGAIGLFILAGTGKLQRLVTPKSLLFLGDISYGLYLVHILVLIETWKFLAWVAPGFLSSQTPTMLLWVRFAIVGPVSVLLAYVSRWYFEEPLLKLKSSLAP